MSHASGLVRFNSDGAIYHFEYDGTSDWCASPIYAGFEEMKSHWRDQPYIRCECEHDEDVTIFTTYGNGFYWEGKACRECMCITEGKNPDPWDGSVNTTDGYPIWATEYYKNTSK